MNAYTTCMNAKYIRPSVIARPGEYCTFDGEIVIIIQRNSDGYWVTGDGKQYNDFGCVLGYGVRDNDIAR